MNFMTIGDAAFYKTVEISVRQVRRFYPDSTFYIYDWGFSNEQRESLRQTRGVELVDWTDRFVDASALWKVDWLDILAGFRSRRWNGVVRAFRKSVAKGLGRHRQRLDFEKLVFQKPFCILDCLGRSRDGLVFLDGDAFLANTIDEVFDGTFGVGVTVRRLDEIDFQYNDCQVINSGVIFFSESSQDIVNFVKYWIKYMTERPEYYSDQTSLTRIIHLENKDIFDGYYRTGTVTVGTDRIRIKTFPCEMYNYNWIEEGVDVEDNKIWHFKGARHSAGRFEELIAAVNIDQ